MADNSPVSSVRTDDPLKIAGELTIQGIEEFRAAIADYLSRGSNHMIDLSGVERCDAAGLELICSASRTFGGHRPVQFTSPSNPVLDIATALGFDTHEITGCAPQNTAREGEENRGL
jgi:anti-anti-sigma regulatory factor